MIDKVALIILGWCFGLITASLFLYYISRKWRLVPRDSKSGGEEK